MGLDPELEKLPAGVSRDAAGVVRFCIDIIAATQSYTLAYKPNVAFFEALGPEGWAALARVRDAIPSDIPVIADAKRGDLDNTARAYARAFFDVLHVDAITVSPYLGPDSLMPFMRYPGRCIFVLCKTSNPGAGHLQDLPVQGGPLYMEVARWSLELEGATEVGLVVGATQPDAVREVRTRFPAALLLLPGVGG
ncbi:MAG: hypothetical protein NVSMB22_04660 [Chloroflexota bacterium]